jgi:transposase
MKHYSQAAVERTMKVHEVILRAMSKEITWYQAAEIIGVSCRQMRRWKERWEQHGYEGLFDRRRGHPSQKRVAVATLEKVLQLYRERYFDFNVRHFHEKLEKEHQLQLSYTWVKTALQTAGLVKRARKRGKHRKRRERRPLPGMLLHIDGSKHSWFADGCYYDLIVIMDDATSEIYYAQLVAEESTCTVMTGLREVIETKGIFCSLYSDRASHFFLTPKAGEPVAAKHLTQVGRALTELTIRPIPAYSPQARGRSERNFRTWQGRLPQELRVREITTVAAANEFLRATYIAEFNAQFAQPAKQPGTAFIACRRQDLDLVFALQHERAVGRDNTLSYNNLVLQIEKTKWRYSLAGCKLKVYEHLDGTISLGYGPHIVGHYSASGVPLVAVAAPRQRGTSKNKRHSDKPAQTVAMEMPPPRKAPKNGASLGGLEKSGQKTKAA